MHFEPNPDVFDAFLAARQGKFIVGLASFVIGIVFLVGRRMVTCDDDGRPLKAERVVRRYEALVKRDVLGLLGVGGLIVGTIYLIWSSFPIH